MGNPILGYGTSLTWNSVVVAALTKINGVELKVDSVDVTTHQSANAYKEMIPGLIDASEVSIEGLFDYTDTTGQHAVLADLNSRTLRTGIITFPAATGTTWTFSGYCMGCKIGDALTDGTIPFTASFKPSGKPTFAVAAAAGMSNLVISESAVVSPGFLIGTFDYVATVLTAITSVTFTPTSAAGTITITANGISQTVVSTHASSAIALGAPGSITTVVVVISEANKAPKTYTVRVVRGV